MGRSITSVPHSVTMRRANIWRLRPSHQALFPCSCGVPRHHSPRLATIILLNSGTAVSNVGRGTAGYTANIVIGRRSSPVFCRLSCQPAGKNGPATIQPARFIAARPSRAPLCTARQCQNLVSNQRLTFGVEFGERFLTEVVDTGSGLLFIPPRCCGEHRSAALTGLAHQQNERLRRWFASDNSLCVIRRCSLTIWFRRKGNAGGE